MLQFIKLRSGSLWSARVAGEFFDEIVDLGFDLLAEMANG